MIKPALYLLIFIVLWLTLWSRKIGWRAPTWWVVNVLLGAVVLMGVM